MGSNCGTDGWSEPVPERGLHPLKSSAFRGALYRQLTCQCGSARFWVRRIRNRGSGTQEAGRCV
jgi:hypothetical protein